MQSIESLRDFLTKKMSMTEVYQPVVILTLLNHNGKAKKSILANALAAYDFAIQEYYEKILMRWPKITLLKHNIVEYDQKRKEFSIDLDFSNNAEIDAIKSICEEKISDWIQAKKENKDPELNPSKRYEILKKAKGKCELCGISSKISPIDIDHVIPQSKARKDGKVLKNEEWIDVNSEENLQALCFRCNRAKRDLDATDFHKRKKLVRDLIPLEIQNSGRNPIVKVLSENDFKKELEEKLIEEHSEYINSKSNDELAEMMEVIFSLANVNGLSEREMLDLVYSKRAKKGGFQKKLYLEKIEKV